MHYTIFKLVKRPKALRNGKNNRSVVRSMERDHAAPKRAVPANAGTDLIRSDFDAH